MEPLSELLDTDHIALDVQAPDLDACLAIVADRCALAPDACLALSQGLRDRERLGTTAIGRGVAVPHAYVDGLPRVMLLFARLARPLNVPGADGTPVDLLLVLAGPREAQAGHLPLLARLVRLLHDQRLLDALRRAATPADVLAALQDVERRHA